MKRHPFIFTGAVIQALAPFLAKLFDNHASTHMPMTHTKRVRWKRRNGYHEIPRFARKMQKYGMEYRPGKLFKGHRI